MSIGDFFKGLVLDAWYKAFMYVGGIALLLSFFLDVKGLTNSQLQLIAGGIFLIGIGEWNNHKKDSWIKPPNAYTGPTALITQTVWRPDLFGLALDLLGVALLITGAVSIVGDVQSSSATQPITTVVPATTPTLTPMPMATETPLPTETIVPILNRKPDLAETGMVLEPRPTTACRRLASLRSASA
jgi:hypothetical protein